jgi:hypothetical protein
MATGCRQSTRGPGRRSARYGRKLAPTLPFRGAHMQPHTAVTGASGCNLHAAGAGIARTPTRPYSGCGVVEKRKGRQSLQKLTAG